MQINALGQPGTVSQLPPTDLPFCDALEPGSLEIVGLDAPLGGGPLGEQPLEHAPPHPDHTAVLADLDRKATA